MSFNFLPTNKSELKQKYSDNLDVIIISGDAYIDHHSFGAALIGRYLEYHGFKVGIIPQPDWRKEEDFKSLGKPKLFFAITSGNLDSMVANYNSEKKKRKTDDFSENGEPGKRPDQALIVYSNMVKKLFPDSIIILGGIEASLRRFAYYDFWNNKIRRPLIFDCRANLIIYGMAEKAVLETAKRIKKNQSIELIPNTSYLSKNIPLSLPYLEIPSFEEVLKEKSSFGNSVKLYQIELSKKKSRAIIQRCQNSYVVTMPPDNLEGKEFDELYTLPFTRLPHPRYKKNIPAYGFVKDSVISHRGCYGGCSFCSLTLHQGKHIKSRSEESILYEVENIMCMDESFKGSLLDVGGPSANMYKSYCLNEHECSRISCLFPEICDHLYYNHKHQIDLLSQISKFKKIKNVFINSGIRYDLAVKDLNYMDALCKKHISGQLSIAPEHISSSVLKLMKKPHFSIYEDFVKKFDALNKKYNKKQYVIPYFISSHPGCTLNDMYTLSLYLKKNKMRIKQVQNFIPLPMTVSSAMYYCEEDIFTNKKIHVAKNEERTLQRALLQPYLPNNFKFIRHALKLLNKEKDLIYLTKNF